MDVFDALARARVRGEHVALVTVVGVHGEAPSRTGAKLVAGADGVVHKGVPVNALAEAIRAAVDLGLVSRVPPDLRP